MKKPLIAKIFFALFVIASALDLLAILIDHAVMQALFKPMIMLSLMLSYFFSVTQPNYYYLLAMAFAFLGDIFLLDKNNMFLLGILAFLLTQLLYIFIISRQLPRSGQGKQVLAVLPFFAYYFYLIYELKDHLGTFLIPVLVYGFVISVFGIVSLLNYLLNRSSNSGILLLGASLFILSDSMIAFQKFQEPRFFFPFAIMLTYILAQFFIFTYMRKAEATKSLKEV